VSVLFERLKEIMNLEIMNRLLYTRKSEVRAQNRFGRKKKEDVLIRAFSKFSLQARISIVSFKSSYSIILD